jgi:hypothetical protein
VAGVNQSICRQRYLIAASRSCERVDFAFSGKPVLELPTGRETALLGLAVGKFCDAKAALCLRQTVRHERQGSQLTDLPALIRLRARALRRRGHQFVGAIV